MHCGIKRFLSLFLIVSLLLCIFTSCSDGVEEKIPADFGTYGADFARELASQFPYRKAYSGEENQAGAFIRDELENLGFEVEVQSFNSVYGGISYNYIVRVNGAGFVDVSMDNPSTDDVESVPTRKTAVIGAHYDSAFAQNEVPAEYAYDGISDNASGIGCLMTIAAQISNYTENGFDVILVAFGAGNDDFAGARHFYASLTEEERNSIEVMYCIDSIYAGDKIYANSGMNSLNLSQKYAMRRKLYQVYDVCYTYELASRNGFSLLYNESNIVQDINGDGVEDAYREVSLHRSDYVVFDAANIPVVYFDSCDYFFDSIEEMKETKNLNLQDFGGNIRSTFLDSSAVLDEILVNEERDLLEVRINNVAFAILESMLKGSDYGLTASQYDEYVADLARRSDDESAATSVEG